MTRNENKTVPCSCEDSATMRQELSFTIEWRNDRIFRKALQGYSEIFVPYFVRDGYITVANATS